MNDYRNTKYCLSLDGISDRKEAVKAEVLKDHPRARNIYKYVSKSTSSYRKQFIDAYNSKCSYCGTSISILTQELFEIDHYRHKELYPTEAEAGKIDNLVLSCKFCNRNKSDFNIPDAYIKMLYPDNDDIKRIFFRDRDFYIKISEPYSNDCYIKSFYNTLKLHSEIHRLDFLIMNLEGLKEKVKGKNDRVYVKLDEIMLRLKDKRNYINIY